MPTELEELIGFIAHPNPQIRLVAAENSIPYSLSEPSIFKSEDLKPIKHLKASIQDEPKIAEHGLSMLINLTGDPEILERVATDSTYIERLLSRIVKPDEPNADLMAMVLANLTKHDDLKSLLTQKQTAPEELGSDDSVLNQLMDLFVKGQDKGYNKTADFDYLAYVFADLSKHEDVRQFFVTEQKYNSVIPLTKLKVFTEHKSDIRRKGVASTIKNVAFDIDSHPSFISEQGIDILPYILLPITGSEEYDVDETMDMLPDLQLLPPDKKRDHDVANVQTHVETLTILTTTRTGRDHLRAIKVYPVIRETHARVDDEGVKEACDRLVQVLMRDEEGEGKEMPKVEELMDDEDVVEEV